MGMIFILALKNSSSAMTNPHLNSIEIMCHGAHQLPTLIMPNNQQRHHLRIHTDVQSVCVNLPHHLIFFHTACIVVKLVHSKKDPRNPGRWRPSYLCHSTESKINDKLKPYKESILNRSEERDDEWAHNVRRRIDGALSDMNAAEARYHADCMSHLFSGRCRAGEKNWDSSS